MAKPKAAKKERRPVVAYEPKGYTPKEITQKILTTNLFENLSLDPAYVPNMFVSNVLQRSLARMTAQGPKGPVVVKATPEGNLAVVSRGGAFDDYERQDYTFVISGAERTTDGTTANRLVDSSENFITQGIKQGDAVFNTTDSTLSYVVSAHNGYLILEDDIFISGENYKLYPCKDFTLSRQVERIDIFTYNGKVDYQITRDLVKALGAKIPLFEDSFYSLDFYTRKIRATPVNIPTTATRSTIFGWFRAEE